MRTIFSLVIVSILACSPKTGIHLIDNKDAYADEHIKWQNLRVKSLTAPEGWLSVVGLYWLKEGSNKIGSADGVDIHLAEFGRIQVADLVLEGDSLYMHSGGENYITLDQKRFTGGAIESDVNGTPTKLAYKSLIFYVIKRGDKYGLRVKNTLADARYRLKEIPSYPIDYDLIVDARVKTFTDERTLEVSDVSGVKQDLILAAELEFSIQGSKQKLLAYDGGPDYFFLTFSDNTNGAETYGGGRYIDVPRPKDGANVCVIDFNKAYNPPCVYTDFATCPIPPSQNHLDLMLKAGERSTK